MMKSYNPTVEWTGNLGEGTKSYTSYNRDHIIRACGKSIINGSSDATFRGDPTRHNPEDLLVASVSACHMLWYLHLCASAGIVVMSYVDQPEGTMVVEPDGSGKFTSIVLMPQIRISEGDESIARHLHKKAHEMCFIANSVNFSITIVSDFVRSA